MFLFLFPGFIEAQVGTDLDEYRYLSKGFGYQKEMGLDAEKEGYSIKKVYTTRSGAKVYVLIQDIPAETKGLVFELPASDGIHLHYFAVPTPGSSPEVAKLYAQELRKLLSGPDWVKWDEAIREYMFHVMQLGAPEMAFFPPAPEAVLAHAEPSQQRKGETGGKASKASAGSNVKGKEVYGWVEGSLQDRELLDSGVLENKSSKVGTLVIKVCIDANGEILSAKYTQRGSTLNDAPIMEAAINTAKKFKFAKSQLPEECGTIRFILE